MIWLVHIRFAFSVTLRKSLTFVCLLILDLRFRYPSNIQQLFRSSKSLTCLALLCFTFFIGLYSLARYISIIFVNLLIRVFIFITSPLCPLFLPYFFFLYFCYPLKLFVLLPATKIPSTFVSPNEWTLAPCLSAVCPAGPAGCLSGIRAIKLQDVTDWGG